jgi:hypothetical protein
MRVRGVLLLAASSGGRGADEAMRPAPAEREPAAV